MKRIVACVVILAFFTTGCTGSFNLTRKVYNWHRSQSDKWADELCFLLVTFIPIYSFATFADAIVFNSIEFWTGKNPVEMSSLPSSTKVARNGKDNLSMSYNTSNGQVRVATADNHGYIFERTDNGVLAKNDQGQVLFRSVQSENGDVSVFDATGKLVKNYPAGQIAMLKEKYIKQ